MRNVGAQAAEARAESVTSVAVTTVEAAIEVTAPKLTVVAEIAAASEKYKDRGPFMNAEISVLLPQNIDDNEINKEYNFIDYKSKYPKKD